MHIQIFRDWTGLPWLTNIPVLEGNQETMKETLFFWRRMLANKLIICFKLLKYQCKCEQMLSAQFLGWTLCWLVLFLSWSLNSPCLCHCRCSCWPSGWGRLPSVREHWANPNRADQFERWGCSSDYSGSRLLAPFAAQVLRVFFWWFDRKAQGKCCVQFGAITSSANMLLSRFNRRAGWFLGLWS